MKDAQTEVEEIRRQFEENTQSLRQEKTALEIEVAELEQVCFLVAFTAFEN